MGYVSKIRRKIKRRKYERDMAGVEMDLQLYKKICFNDKRISFPLSAWHCNGTGE